MDKTELQALYREVTEEIPKMKEGKQGKELFVMLLHMKTLMDLKESMKEKSSELEKAIKEHGFKMLAPMQALQIPFVPMAGHKYEPNPKESVTGLSDVDIEVWKKWGDKFGHANIWEEKIVEGKLKPFVITHMTGNPSDVKGEEWHGDKDVPNGVEYNVFTLMKRTKLKGKKKE